MRNKKVIPIIFDTYIAVIKNSVGSRLFRNFYAKVNNRKTDVMRNGDLSCAFYLSSVLFLFKLIQKTHATVDSTIIDLRESGWKLVKKPLIGSVIVWKKIAFKNGEVNKHIGFYIGKNQAISNNDRLGYPIKHHWTFKSKREVEMILKNPILK